MSHWLGPQFDTKANHLLGAVALQISHRHPPLVAGGTRLTLGMTLAAASSSSGSEVSLVIGKAGILPAVEGDLLITPNLYLTGLYWAFATGGDVIVLYRYGVNFLPGGSESQSSSWLITFQRSQMEGPDDFFLKTVDVAIVRQINLKAAKGWFGLGSYFYTAGVHVRNRENSSTHRDRLEGSITAPIMGLQKRLGERVAVEIEMNVHPHFLSIMVAARRIIG